jgi:hypothetical protein
MGQEADPLIPIDSAIETIVDDANQASRPQADRAGSVPDFLQNPQLLGSPSPAGGSKGRGG